MQCIFFIPQKLHNEVGLLCETSIQVPSEQKVEHTWEFPAGGKHC